MGGSGLSARGKDDLSKPTVLPVATETYAVDRYNDVAAQGMFSALNSQGFVAALTVREGAVALGASQA